MDRVEYEVDDADSAFIEKMRQQFDLPATVLDEDKFEIILDRIEKKAFQRSNKRILDRDLGGPQANDDVPCAVCNDRDYEAKNLIVFCDGCSTSLFFCVRLSYSRRCGASGLLWRKADSGRRVVLQQVQGRCKECGAFCVRSNTFPAPYHRGASNANFVQWRPARLSRLTTRLGVTSRVRYGCQVRGLHFSSSGGTPYLCLRRSNRRS